MAYLNNHHSKIYNMVQLGQKAGQRIKQASQFASTIKGIYDDGRMIYNAARTIAPLDKYSSHPSKSINNHVMNAVKSYDDITNKVLENHDNLYNDYNHIKNKIFLHVTN